MYGRIWKVRWGNKNISIIKKIVLGLSKIGRIKVLMKLEVLVTTMHQPDMDMSLYREMNLQTDAVIANQANRNKYVEEIINGNTVKMMTTMTRGTSRNRNIALELSTADYVMFSDDDIRFVDNYEEIIAKEFSIHPEADAIQFQLNVIAISDEKKIKSQQEVYNTQNFHRATRREVARYGVCGCVIKTEILKKYCLFFNENFGPGTENYCGEDTIFLQSMIHRGIKYYMSSYIIGDIDKSGTSWFEGYNDRYFIVTGKSLAACYPRISWLLAIRSSYRFHKRNIGKKFIELLFLYWKGIKEYTEEMR